MPESRSESGWANAVLSRSFSCSSHDFYSGRLFRGRRGYNFANARPSASTSSPAATIASSSITAAIAAADSSSGSDYTQL